MASFWSPFSHENAFCDSFSFFEWFASCLQKICPLPLPCCCSSVFLSHVNLTWFKFSTVPLGTVKIPLCIHSSGLVRRIMAEMSLHVYFFKLGGVVEWSLLPFLADDSLVLATGQWTHHVTSWVTVLLPNNGKPGWNWHSPFFCRHKGTH